jgi:leucine dehydrogenase
MLALMQRTRVQTVHMMVDEASGLRAIIAVHAGRPLPALGGCRYLAYPDDDSALADAIRLAQDMTYKAALAGLPFNGGKAVILRGPQVDDRARLFEAFGRFVDSLQGRYITAVDSGTSTADMDCVAQATCYVTSTTAAGDPSAHTALGVFAGIRSTAMARLGSDNLEGLRVAIQGLGQVGFGLAEHLHAAGAELLVSDTDPGRVQLAVEQLNARPVGGDSLPTTPCDIFAPCAYGGILGPKAVAQLRCAAVAGSANAQLTGLEAADQLESRGILYAPDYVINAGGLIQVALQYQGAQASTITDHLGGIGKRLTDIFAQSQATHHSPARIAHEMAERLVYG